MAADQPVNEEAEAEVLPLVVWLARASLYLLLQGAIVLATYLVYGFGKEPSALTLGFRVDPLQAGAFLLWGALGTYIGFFNFRWATAYVVVSSVLFTLLAAVGSFAPDQLGLYISNTANVFHWIVAALSWTVGLRALYHERLGA
jgi:hypothetical protein